MSEKYNSPGRDFLSSPYTTMLTVKYECQKVVKAFWRVKHIGHNEMKWFLIEVKSVVVFMLV